MTDEPVHANERVWQATAGAKIARRTVLVAAPLAVAAVTLPRPGHAAAPEVECLADLWADR